MTRRLSSLFVRFSPRTLLLIAGAIAASVALGSCDRSPTGPSLANVALSGVTLQSTVGNASLCCCRVVGTATNQNDRPVHVTLKFSAFDGQNALPLSTVVYFIEDLQPRATHRIDASGFLFSCARIADLKTEIDVRSPDDFPPF